MTASANPRFSAFLALTAAALLAAPHGAQARPALTRAPFAEANLPAGTLVISQSQRRLFLLQGGGMAISYPIAVGKAGKAWSGWARINGKYVQPDWAPPPWSSRPIRACPISSGADRPAIPWAPGR